MQHYKIYEQRDREALDSLFSSQPTAILLTQTVDDVLSGVFNPLVVDDHFYLHLHRRDPQVDALRQRARAKLIFQDVLAVIPSHWIDPHDGGFATTYYRYAELTCEANLHTDPQTMTSILDKLMRRHQPEGGYDPLDHRSSTYARSYATILVVELTPVSITSKWKLGQNRPPDVRRRVMAHLRARNQGQDLRAADEVEKSLTQLAPA